MVVEEVVVVKLPPLAKQPALGDGWGNAGALNESPITTPQASGQWHHQLDQLAAACLGPPQAGPWRGELPPGTNDVMRPLAP